VSEHRIELDGKLIPVDGFCAETNTIYQFHGCFWHGCPHCYELEQFTPHRVHKNTDIPLKFGDLYAYTQHMTERYQAAGYTVMEMWECQWKDYAIFKKIDTTKRDVEYLKTIVPRDAYFGGRTNAVKLYYKCRGAEKIHYMDITSCTLL
jgi:G:T-mismatch repair DNA endonuclease (very short patch repair protein)